MFITLTDFESKRPVYINDNYIMAIYSSFNGDLSSVIESVDGGRYNAIESCDVILQKIKEARVVE